MDNKKKIILSILIILLILAIGVTYAFFTYNSGAKSEIVTGQIYMNYEETSNISLTNVWPETKAQALSRNDNNGVFEFTITGRNTSDKPIYYEIDLLDGGIIAGKTASSTKIAPEHVMIYLERDGEVLIDGMTYNDWNNRRIYIENIPVGTSNIEHKYTLRMWIDEKVSISDTSSNAEYTTSEWNDSYVSLKVRVTGDFIEKNTPYNYMARLGTADIVGDGSIMAFWPDSINEQAANITEVNFVEMKQSEIDTIFENAPIKEDLTDTGKRGSVKAWLENGEVVTAEDGTETQQYVMYIASEGITFLPTNCSIMFAFFENLKGINFDNVNTSQVTDMSLMFGMSGVTELDLSSFDTGNVTNMDSMFGMSGVTELDLSNFDTSNVTDMSSMFVLCSNLTSVDVSGFDTSNVTDMSQMFALCSSLTSIDVSGFDTSSVTDMSSMFNNCSNLTSLDVSGFDTSSVTDMSSMFDVCSNLTSVDVSGFDTSSVTDMCRMFYGCSKLTNLDVSGFDTTNVTNISYMFNECSNLTSLDVSGFDTSSVTDMSSMFRRCESLTKLDVSSFDTSNVIDMQCMFEYCESLTKLDVSGFDTRQVTNMMGMFSDCYSLTTIYSNADWNTENVTSSSYMFYYCTKLVGAVSYNSSKEDVTMANPTTGYFTRKEA